MIYVIGVFTFLLHFNILASMYYKKFVNIRGIVMRETILIPIGILGGAISTALGGWDTALQALVYFMVIDYLSGITLASVFKKSKKSKTGTLNSYVGFKGIVKKCMMLLIVLIGYQLDHVIGWDFIRNAVIIAFIANELISIIENAGLMGVPVPKPIIQALEILKKKGDNEDEDNKRNTPN